jgi:hypothetical protein
MKQKLNKIDQSSRAVQHTHSGAQQQQQQQGQEHQGDGLQPDKRNSSLLTPATNSQDTRMPVDLEKRALNRTLGTDTVLNLLAGTLPEIVSKAFTVGGWVWIAFDTAPAPETRQQLSQLGFHWNSKRQLWQHPCGKYSYGSKADPRDTYTTKPAMEAYN